VKIDLLIQTYKETLPKVLRALIGWGFGMLLMILYCLFVLYLKTRFNVYIMLFGAVVSLILAYIIIDIWWNYNLRLMEENRGSQTTLFRYNKE
jgi:hypothetical protein